MAALVLAACAAHRAEPRWSSPLLRQHPLVGRIWDVRGARWTSEARMMKDLARAPVVLLGEKHDNPDHHRLQARIVRELARQGRRPAVAFEMIETDRQSTVDAALAEAPQDADQLAHALDWRHSGWPDFALYRPVFEAALGAGLPIVAANLPRQTVRGLVAHGLEVLDPAVTARLGLAAPTPEPVRRAMTEELREAHCGMLPASILPGMVLAQRGRDAQMAERLRDRPAGAVLIAGSGHVRTDRGVPAWLPGITARSLSFEEVAANLDRPTAYASRYAAARLPFDYVWFTPVSSDDDPCAAFHR